MEPYTRAAFQAQRAALGKIGWKESLALLVVSVGGGVAQLIFLRWADAHMANGPKLRIAGPAFLVYIALVAILMTQLVRAKLRARIACPQCGAPLGDDSLRIAAATGRCDTCGGQVIAQEQGKIASP
ncbi:MAG TPA: hypothetical protein VFW45_03880 [Candidatus Polarisedimenticolia bacterium]|nr:hypothetical protein [Candidatus Polarisedimenticolia bacterium]